MDESLAPPTLRSLLTSEVAAELAAVYDDQPVFPERTVVDRPEDDERLFPGWPTPVLVISVENQGVCTWGVPLGDPNPPVLVGGDLLDRPDAATVQYAPSIDDFIAVRRWDAVCLNQAPLIQAQASPLDADSLTFLRHQFTESPPTAGWPWTSQYRFDDGTVKVMLWSGADQCDWWISSADRSAIKAVVGQLLRLSDLRDSLWSHDDDGERLLVELRGTLRPSQVDLG